MQHRVWDAAGTSVSALCLVHCLALPVAAAAVPVLTTLAEAEWIHWSLLAAAAPTAALALTSLPRRSRWRRFAVGAGSFGLGLMFIGAVEVPSHAWGEVITIIGASSLALAHVTSWRIKASRAATGCYCPEDR